MVDAIKASSFCTNDSEQTNLNWFCYEFSNSLYDSLIRDENINPVKISYGKHTLADFCKNLATTFVPKLPTKFDRKKFPLPGVDDFVLSYFPKFSPTWLPALRQNLDSAWELMMMGCSLCRDKCLKNKNSLNPEFSMIILEEEDDDDYSLSSINSQTIDITTDNNFNISTSVNKKNSSRKIMKKIKKLKNLNRK
ncbi:MAG: hypothetical protein LBR11_09490 [Deltaproteobacteria bacterium]|jgi:hypothetical protein|nr:hypothetical protein [Deltaproteobacteria bacterium]